ncbi:MAG: trehalose 6-phosphate synthase, partial [Pseudonocardiales bacterium]|nr:trehalose 6-phosphate synthase [Pseudonocardiales bacterium]
MGAAAVVIAANRGPISFRRSDDGGVSASRGGGGGLVSAMAGLAADVGALWVCAALSDLDREVAANAPDSRLDQAGYADAGAVQMLPVDADVFDGAYNAIANSTLWFLHHELTDSLPAYDEPWRQRWDDYVSYNQQFAAAISAEAAPEARVLVQDYHLALLPAMLRGQRPDLRIAHFTHTPWATPATFATLPADIARGLLVGMLGADSIGFHSRRWGQAFINCCVGVLDTPGSDHEVRYDGHRSAVRVHPLGVEPAPLLARAAEPDVAERRAQLAKKLDGRRAIVRVDRTEPSKNIVRGLEAFRTVIAHHLEYRDRVVHVALAYPSRQDVADYRRYTEQVQAVAAEINDEFGNDHWTPVLLSVVDDFAQSLATLSIGDVVLVNPVRDGMNLVAKEAMLLTDDAVLVLSAAAGAADEMGAGALLVDPYDVAATADALHEALQ